MPEFLSVYITAGSTEEAEKIARVLVEEKSVACANVFPGVVSFYRWAGQTERTAEHVLIAKTTAEKFAAVEKKVKEIHSYDCPCIVATPIVSGSEDYLEWIRKSVNG